MVIIDTSIWVDILRPGASASRAEFTRLAQAREAASVGIIYAEVLRGAKSEAELEELRERLEGVAFVGASKSTWDRAGRLLSELQRQGNMIPFQDAVIAAQALEGGHALFTTDLHFRRVPGLLLHEAPGGAG